MKSTTLIALLRDGTMHSVASPSFGPIDELAGIIRRERSVKVGKDMVPVVSAVVLTQNAGTATVVKRISCDAEAHRERIIAEAAKVAKEQEAESVKKKK